MSKKKTHKEYIDELLIKNPTIEVVEQYIDANTKILHHCLIHNVYWKTTPSRALQGVGCEMCRKEKFRKTKCKTHQQYIEELNIINPNIKVIEKYIDATTPIKHYCVKHNIYWNIPPDSVLHGHGCVECGKDKIGDKNRKTHEQYIRELKLTNPNIEALGIYVNSNTPMLHKCLIDGYEWYTSPANILFGTGCPKCAGTLKKTHDEYVYELSFINPNIVVIEQYINARTQIKHKCKVDGYIWSATPSSILCGCGCPKCNESKGERYISKWLNNNHIQYKVQKTFNDCRDKYVLPFDFYLPEYNVCIEYQGEQHYHSVDFFGGEKTFKKQQKHDNIKREYCKNNGIRLLEIPYYANIEEELNNFLFI